MNIEQNEYGATEHSSFDNWAAEYAKKLYDTEVTERSTALTNGLKTKVDTTQYASIDKAGVIKLARREDVNKSGIIVDETDGTAYIATKTNGGIMRDGAGGLYVVGATVAEVSAGTDTYKPVTPSVFKTSVENITGKAASLKALPAERNGSTVTTVPKDIVSAYNTLATYVDSVGAIDYIDNDDFTTTILSGQKAATMTLKSGYAYLEGYYIFSPKDLVKSSKTYPIGSITIKDRGGNTMTATYDFHEGTTYLLYFELDNSTVVCTISQTEEYRTTPRRAGTWVDGTPVWRVALPITKLTDLAYKGDGSKESILATDVLLRNKSVSSTENLIYIDDALIFQNSPSYDHDSFAEGVSKASPGVYNLAVQDNDHATHVYGWIEFAADKSIIKGVSTEE